MYITGIDPTKLAELDAESGSYIPDFLPGSIGMAHDGKIYKYLQYDTGQGSVAAAAGSVAFYYTVDGYKNNQCTCDVTDSSGVGAGVLAAAPVDTQYAWVQIKGAATLTTSLTAGSDGNALTAVGAGDSTLDVSFAVTDAIVAYAGDASDDEIICDFPF